MLTTSRSCLRGPERVHSEMHGKLIFEHPDGEAPVAVVLQDLSVEGAGLIYPGRLEKGVRLLLHLPLIHGMPLSLHARVVQSRMIEPGRHRIGLQFETHDSAALERLRDALLL